MKRERVRYLPLRRALGLWMQAAFACFSLASAAAAPTRIVSTNVCTDQLLLLLADRGQIAALSSLSQDPKLSNMAAEAKGLPQNGARAEEIVPFRPDLVLANAWTGAKANHFLAGLGVRVVVVPEANDFAGVEAAIALVGAEIGQGPRAQSAIAAMRARLASVRRPVANRTALIYEPNGYSPAAGTLSDAVLREAGWTNLAPALGVRTYGAVALERVVMTQPDLLIFDDHAPSEASRAQSLLHHPALRAVAKNARVEWLPAPLTLCAGPWTVEAVARLAKIERRP